MKQSFIASLLLHTAFMFLVAIAPGFAKRRIVIQEKIIPVNVIRIPAMPPSPAPASLGDVDRLPRLPAAAVPRVPAPDRTPPKGAERVPARRTVVIPDLVTKLEPVAPAATSLRDKVQNRLQMTEPPPPAAAAARRQPPPDAEAHQPRPVNSVQRSLAAGSSMAVESLPPNLAALGFRGTAPPGAPAVSLEGADFPQLWYVAIVQNQIYENWEPPQRLLVLSPGAGTLVRFAIHRDGKITEVVIKTSSGYTLLDRSALEAVKRLVNLPSLPADYKEDVLHVVVFFQPFPR